MSTVPSTRPRLVLAASLLLFLLSLASLLSWGGCVAPKPSLLKARLLGGPAPSCRVSSAAFADLHIHPFERFFQRREPKGRFVLFVDRAPLRRLQHSGLSLVVASLVMPQYTGLSVKYGRAQKTTPDKTTWQQAIRRAMTHEITTAKGLLVLENALLACCAQKDDRARKAAIDRFRNSDTLRRWKRRFKDLPGAFQRLLAQHIRWRLRQQKQHFLCQIKGAGDSDGNRPCGKPFQVVRTAAEAKQAIAAGKIAVILALEQLGFIATPDDVDFFYRQGIRLSTLVHLSDNCLTGSADIPWAHSGITLMQKGLSGFRASLPKRRCTAPLPTLNANVNTPSSLSWQKCQTPASPTQLQANGNQGLTRRGAAVVWQMIRRGMLIDLSHSTEGTLRQLLWCQTQQRQRSSAPQLPPFLVSHTNFRRSRPGKRLPEYPISSSHLQALYQGGGMIGMGFHRDAITHMYPTPSTPGYGQIKPPLSSFLPDQATNGTLNAAQRQELWELRSALHNMHALIMGHGGPRTIAFGTDYNGRIDPPDLLSMADKLPQLIALLQRHQCSLYKQMAGSAAALIKLWKRVESVARQWQRKPPQVGMLCPGMQGQLHASCPR